MVDAVTEEQLKEFKSAQAEIPQEQLNQLDTLASRSPREVQSEFENFMASLPPNFRTGLSKIVDVQNLTPEQLRGMLVANSTTGMDEVIRAAQFGDERSGGGLDLRTAQQHSQEGQLVHVSDGETGRLTPPHSNGRGGPSNNGPQVA